MAVTANDVVNWMASKVGMKESPLGSNNITFNTTYYGRPVSGSNYAWCQAMIWVCFKELGILNLYGTKSAYTVFVASAFNQQGRFYRSNPKPGDMVFFDWGGSKNISAVDHVGIVVRDLGGGYVETIEGNTSNMVQRLKRSTANIVGYARPAYGSSGSSSGGSSSTGSTEKTYTVKSGDSLWKISNENGMSVNSLKDLNNLTSDTIYIGQILKLSLATSSNSGSSTTRGSVSDIQRWANTYSFNNIAVDNISGPATKKAIIKVIQHELNVQFNAGLIIDGVWGPASKSAWITIRQGAKGNLTRCVQALLILKGYSTNGFDGDFGSGTANSTGQFQSASSIASDKVVGKDTISKLVV